MQPFSVEVKEGRDLEDRKMEEAGPCFEPAREAELQHPPSPLAFEEWAGPAYLTPPPLCPDPQVEGAGLEEDSSKGNGEEFHPYFHH